MSTLNTIIFDAGLATLWDTLKNNWIGPLFFMAIAGFGLLQMKERSFTKLLTLIGVAAIVGVLIFFGSNFFGSSGSLTGAAKDVGSKVSAQKN